jgi:hypothetical protein
MPFSAGSGYDAETSMPSVRTRGGVQDRTDPQNRVSKRLVSYEWGMANNPQGGQAPGVHKGQPLLQTWIWVRAQIGTRPVQTMPRGDAGQSEGQVAGHGPNFDQRNGSVGSSFDGLFQNGSPEPIHIARFFRAANTGYGGYNSIGRAAGGSSGVIGGTGDNFTTLKRPLQRFPTRGPRSMSGAMNPKSRFDDLGRIASVFVPTTPLK